MHDHEAGLQPRDVYAPPDARVVDADARDGAAAAEFYAVSIRKFWCLYAATFGLYQYYWCYRQWAHYRAWRRETLWPVARAIFAIFFMHALNRKVDASLRDSGATHAWNPGSSATAFVLLSIVSGGVSRLTARSEAITWLDYLNVALILPVGMAMAVTQRAANAACGDRDGAGNARLTPANWAWMFFGSVLWALVLLGFLLPDETI